MLLRSSKVVNGACHVCATCITMEITWCNSLFVYYENGQILSQTLHFFCMYTSDIFHCNYFNFCIYMYQQLTIEEYVH